MIPLPPRTTLLPYTTLFRTLADVTTNAADHAVFPTGSVTFAGGIVGETQTITVVVNGDQVEEGNEKLSTTVGTGTPTATVASDSINTGEERSGATILYDDPT